MTAPTHSSPAPIRFSRPRSLSIVSRFVLAAALVAGISACSGGSATEIIVVHPPVPEPVLVAVTPGAASVGDVRYFNFGAETDAGDPVTIDWIMTTTALDSPAADVETRLSSASLSFGSHNDQLILEGIALYPGADAVLAVGDTSLRAIVGGSGRFAGASGEVASTRFDDGSWRHVITLE